MQPVFAYDGGMNVSFRCPKCEQTSRRETTPDSSGLECQHCGAHIASSTNAWTGEELSRCLICPSSELYVRKGFPPKLGAIIVLGSIAACAVAVYLHEPYWFYAILFGVFFIDAALFLLLPNSLVCYRCGSVYRGAGDLKRHGAFELETHEKHRQQAARMASQARRDVPTEESPVG